MSAATTFAPSRTKTRTDAFAIPDPAPVMTAALPSNSPIEYPLTTTIGATTMTQIAPPGNGGRGTIANGPATGQSHDLGKLR